jgi:hypothetical protein
LGVEEDIGVHDDIVSIDGHGTRSKIGWGTSGKVNVGVHNNIGSHVEISLEGGVIVDCIGCNVQGEGLNCSVWVSIKIVKSECSWDENSWSKVGGRDQTDKNVFDRDWRIGGSQRIVDACLDIKVSIVPVGRSESRETDSVVEEVVSIEGDSRWGDGVEDERTLAGKSEDHVVQRCWS